ncbi:hypothetical protein P9139_00220 [Curtobacterium flaccumfaciens]|nr:hypothetical protein P9139_00220 [Curtobacterium flaccumfaciens]
MLAIRGPLARAAMGLPQDTPIGDPGSSSDRCGRDGHGAVVVARSSSPTSRPT